VRQNQPREVSPEEDTKVDELRVEAAPGWQRRPRSPTSAEFVAPRPAPAGCKAARADHRLGARTFRYQIGMRRN
jgi:hypothetical protein